MRTLRINPELEHTAGGMNTSQYIAEFMTLTDVFDIDNFHIFVYNKI